MGISFWVTPSGAQIYPDYWQPCDFDAKAIEPVAGEARPFIDQRRLTFQAFALQLHPLLRFIIEARRRKLQEIPIVGDNEAAGLFTTPAVGRTTGKFRLHSSWLYWQAFKGKSTYTFEQVFGSGVFPV